MGAEPGSSESYLFHEMPAEKKPQRRRQDVVPNPDVSSRESQVGSAGNTAFLSNVRVLPDDKKLTNYSPPVIAKKKIIASTASPYP